MEAGALKAARRSCHNCVVHFFYPFIMLTDACEIAGWISGQAYARFQGQEGHGHRLGRCTTHSLCGLPGKCVSEGANWTYLDSRPHSVGGAPSRLAVCEWQVSIIQRVAPIAVSGCRWHRSIFLRYIILSFWFSFIVLFFSVSSSNSCTVLCCGACAVVSA